MGGDPRGILKMKPLIKKEAKFNEKCKIHKNLYRNMYCMDCNAKPLCQRCHENPAAGPNHLGHKVIQVTKSTRRNSIRVEEIKKTMDGSDILQLVNNSIFVFMLLTRGKPEEKKHAGKKRHCIKCGFTMQAMTEQPKARYCSIECKLEDVDVDLPHEMTVRDSAATTTDDPKTSSRRTVVPVRGSVATTADPETSSRRTVSVTRRRNYGSVASRCCGIERRRRKGHPHRAPFY